MEDNKIEIVAFKEEYAEAVSDIIRENLIHVNSKHYPETVIKYMHKLFSPDFIIKASTERDIFVAIYDGEIAGTASLEGDMIYSVFVYSRFHKKGLGKAIVTYIEKLARERGIERIKLCASITARVFYEKLGYVHIEEVESNEFGKGFLMEKSLG